MLNGITSAALDLGKSRDKQALIVHCVSKNIPPLTCYNLDIHDSIIFGRNVAKKVRNLTMLCFPSSPI